MIAFPHALGATAPVPASTRLIDSASAVSDVAIRPSGSARLALVALTAAIASLAACLPRGHVEVTAQPRASGDLAAVLAGAQLAQYRAASADDGNRLGDTPAEADDDSRLNAQLASETGMPHLNDELTPAIFDYFKPSFIDWNRNFDGWTQGMVEVWMKTAAITVARAWTPEYVGGVAVASARASRITGQMALGAAAVPNAGAAARTCSGGKCPCFVAGTPVATADGPVAIERVAVGQRVLPASPACADNTAEDAASVTKYDLLIRAADGDVFVIELLRPRDWPHAPGARPGDTVYVELDEINVRGLALVTAREPHPRIDMDSRRGCAVTGTIRHIATRLSVLRLVGDDEPIIATPWHRMYSHTRGDWVAIEDLAAGEQLRTADGAIAVESVVELGGQHEPVFNLEIAGSHRYLVHHRRVLTHNTYGAANGAELRPYGGPGGGHHVPARSAFRGARGYDANAALAIPNAELTRLGVSHSAVTGAQMTGYRAFSQTGAALTWEAVATIETNALIRGGMAADMARATVSRAIQALKEAGVAGPTRIPWTR